MIEIIFLILYQHKKDTNFLSASTSLNILENRKCISQTGNGDFSTIKEAIEWFNAFAITNTEFILDAGYHIVDEIIELNNEFALNIKGLGSDVTKLNITITGSTFSILSECTFSRLTLNGPGTGTTSICFDLNTEKYCEFYDIQINNFDKVFLDKNLNDIFIFNFIINNCSTGIEVDNSTNGGAIDIEIGTIENTPIGINLKASEAKDFIINGIYYYGNLSSNTFINIEPEFGLNGISNIQNCGGNNIGNFQVGFDFSLSSGTYKDVEMLSNTNYEDKKPYFKINVIDNTGTTTVTTAGTYYKANYINGNSFTCKMKLEDNKITFLPTHKKNIVIHVTGNLSVNQNNKNVTIGWNENEEGTIYSPFTVRTAVANQPYGFSFISYFQNISEGDFGELFLTSSSNGDVVRIQDLNIFGQTL
ncbi:hypothetical protein M0Q97_06310 [Candidatus Dojkabacteria bacterium]|nr:hypothetical protein [Candidatus Dojkabacteria bacterium]